MNEKEKAIQNYMKSLDISREEAEQLWEDDHNDYESDEMKEWARKAKENVKRYEQSEKKRAKTTRERKVDETKGQILAEVKPVLENMGATVLEVKTETEIKFAFNGEDYTIKLTKHRKPKGS